MDELFRCPRMRNHGLRILNLKLEGTLIIRLVFQILSTFLHSMLCRFICRNTVKCGFSKCTTLFEWLVLWKSSSWQYNALCICVYNSWHGPTFQQYLKIHLQTGNLNKWYSHFLFLNLICRFSWRRWKLIWIGSFRPVHTRGCRDGKKWICKMVNPVL